MVSNTNAHHPGIECSTNRASICGAVYVPAYGRVDRAVIQARGAADAPQNVFRFRAEQARAAIVHEYDMKVLRSVALA